MITVIDYKAGNLTSVVKALRAIGADTLVTEDPDEVRRADKLVLPGVGHFAATRFLADRGLRQAATEKIAQGTPFLGICVGLQWLFAGSTEDPSVQGAGLFEGMCERFTGAMKIPHVGWNSISVDPASRLLRGIEEGAYVYYTHSWRAPIIKETAAVTNYGQPFTAAVERDNLMAVQFHPEKSSAAGRTLLENFVRLESC
ncbi:imidazole glycerol phosphate synthase subunit HisH [Acidipila rosea]|uniref:Imidazole glycerol phosphate synthase subunit HisH n=1 Tax=Acidipila rosea TaxID=768535 RepID=A0A4R1L1A9_9BACT|nr:imidazole glycerol phosphate synthase subunit HisH [Acidipila rosea]TCK71624.1 glutamine amidotransferase [Acidipila rosea]